MHLDQSAVAQLRSFIEKVERLEEEKNHVTEALKETFAEMKAMGFDVKIFKQVLRMRKMKQDELAEQEELLDVYRHALGMLPNFDNN